MTINSTLGPNGYEVSISAPVSGGGVAISPVTLDAFGSTAAWSSSSAGVPVLAVGADASEGNYLQITTDGTTNNHEVVRTIVADLSAGDVLSLRINMATGFNLLNIAVSLGDTTFAKYAILQDLSIPGSGGGGIADFFPGYWRTVSVGAANVASLAGGATAADLANVRAIRVRIRATAAAAVAKICQFRRYRDTSGPRIIWCFDDGRLNNYTNAYPILRAHGYVGSMACMPASWGTTYVGGGNQPIMSEAQWAEMYAAGWEACGHGETSFNGKSATQIQADLNAFLNWSTARGYARGRSHWIYVGGWFDMASAAIVGRSFVSARRVGGTCNGFQSAKTFEPSQIGNYYNNTSITLAQLKAKIDTLKAGRNGLLVFVFHNVVDSLTAEAEDITTANFAELVAYAKANGCPSTSFDAEFGSLWA